MDSELRGSGALEVALVASEGLYNNFKKQLVLFLCKLISMHF
jgi:hypothetical protein